MWNIENWIRLERVNNKDPSKSDQAGYELNILEIVSIELETRWKWNDLNMHKDEP